MSIPTVGNVETSEGPSADHVRLRRAAKALEGVFLEQLFKAMRSAGPEGGLVAPDTGEQMFTSMLDSELAQQAAQQSTMGLGEALYRQLSRHLGPLGPDAPR